MNNLLRTLTAALIGAALCLLATPFTACAGEDDGSWTSLGEYKITYYCNCRKCCGRWAGGPTASGSMPEQGRTVASSLPLGTHLMIDGHEYVVEDRGVSGKHIDVYLNSHRECLDRGVDRKTVYRWTED